jgi:hypothetical protein
MRSQGVKRGRDGFEENQEPKRYCIEEDPQSPEDKHDSDTDGDMDEYRTLYHNVKFQSEIDGLSICDAYAVSKKAVYEAALEKQRQRGLTERDALANARQIRDKTDIEMTYIEAVSQYGRVLTFATETSHKMVINAAIVISAITANSIYELGLPEKAVISAIKKAIDLSVQTCMYEMIDLVALNV